MGQDPALKNQHDANSFFSIVVVLCTMNSFRRARRLTTNIIWVAELF